MSARFRPTVRLLDDMAVIDRALVQMGTDLGYLPLVERPAAGKVAVAGEGPDEGPVDRPRRGDGVRRLRQAQAELVGDPGPPSRIDPIDQGVQRLPPDPIDIGMEAHDRLQGPSMAKAGARGRENGRPFLPVTTVMLA